MSRTDVHRPAWVKHLDPELRDHFREVHRHWVRSDWDPETKQYLKVEEADCDLDEFLSEAPLDDDRIVRCHLSYFWGPNIFCGCEMCTGRSSRRLARKQDRVIWRAQRQKILKTPEDQLEDIDVPYLHGSMYW